MAKTSMDNSSLFSQSIGLLHLERRGHNALIKAGITTIGALNGAIENGFQNIWFFGPSLRQDAIDSISLLRASHRDDGTIDWSLYCRERGIRLVPNGFVSDGGRLNDLSGLAQAVRELLQTGPEDRRWRIIQRRFGLDGTEKLTLDQLGTAYSLTRERVRQLESRALSELRAVLLLNDHSGRKYHVHPNVVQLTQTIYREVAQNGKDFLLETELYLAAERAVSVDLSSYHPLLILLFRVFGMERISLENSGLVPVWECTNTGQRDNVEEAVRLIDDYLSKEKTTPVDEFDLLVAINGKLPKNRRLSALLLRKCIGLCSSVEYLTNGRVQCKFSAIHGRVNQLERILLEAGQPIHISEMARDFNKRLLQAGEGRLDIRTVANLLPGDSRFVNIGRSGRWGLAVWGNVTSQTIPGLMEECLVSLNRPATQEEIYQYVIARRPASPHSVTMILSSSSKFRKASRKTWGLSTWSETIAPQLWGLREVAEFVASLFRARNATELEFSEIRLALMDAAGVSSREARGMLASNPILQTRRESRPFRVLAALSGLPISEIRSATFHRRQQATTLQQKADPIVRALLSLEPNGQMELSRLARTLEREHGFRDKSGYGYIAKMRFVEKFTDKASGKVFCRLRKAASLEQAGLPALISRLTNLDEDLARQASSAIEKLTLEEVDIAIFLCGRLFESSLRSFMLAAEKSGQYSVSSSNYAKLSNMIDWVRSAGIITDASIADFLRRERNNRAHNAQPSLAERELLMNNASWIARLYLEYTVLFLERRSEVSQ